MLDGFNKGKLSLRNGFIFSDSNAAVMNSTNCVPINASEYVIPRGVKFELKFPGWLANLESYAGEQITDTEEYTTTNIFKIFIDHEDPADALLYLYSSYIIDRLQSDSVVKSYVLKIVLNGEFFRPDENGYYNFNRFVFPCYDSEFYVRQPDGSEVKITKFKCKEFFYSVNYMQRTISVVCDQLSVIMTDIYAISELNRQYSYMPNNFNADRENRDDCHIINMPNVNIQYKTIKSHSSINSKNITKFRIMDYMVNASEDSKRLYLSGTVQIRVNGNYSTMRSTNLLISPYDTEFYGGGDTRIERIYTNSAPLIYNANIKTIRVDSKYTPGTETLESNGILYPLMGIANTYPYLSATRSSAPTPATPMKYIIDKYTLLKVHPGKFFIDNTKGSIYVFDAKSRTVANFEKYIRILVPEDHFQLGTYAFNKYRLPIYNLNETKKYNYSNKTWEPVNATTPDVTYTRQMYGAEARADGLRYV